MSKFPMKGKKFNFLLSLMRHLLNYNVKIKLMSLINGKIPQKNKFLQ